MMIVDISTAGFHVLQMKICYRLEQCVIGSVKVSENPAKHFFSPQPSVTAMVNQLGWKPLQERRHNSRITLLYKVKNNLVEVPVEYHPVPNNNRVSRRVHQQQYVRHQAQNDKYKFAFIPRTIVDWNKLPSNIVEAESLEDLKTRLASRQN